MDLKRLLGFTALLFFIACSVPHKVAKQTKTLDGNWVLAVYRPAQKKTLAEVFGNHTIEMQFNKSTNAVSGTTGCNGFAGTYTADTALLHFSQHRLLTKMACGDYNEQTFLNALDVINRYRIVEGQLELFQDETVVMVFARKQSS